MIRVEIICNQSIEEDIIEVLESHGLGENFTCLYPVFGRGRHGRREGSPVWPEENVIFLLFVEDDFRLDTLLENLEVVKRKFTDEGLRCYVERGVERLI